MREADETILSPLGEDLLDLVLELTAPTRLERESDEHDARHELLAAEHVAVLQHERSRALPSVSELLDVDGHHPVCPQCSEGVTRVDRVGQNKAC